MPLDMPPQPAYHVERAAPAPEASAFVEIARTARELTSRAAREISERLRMSEAPSPTARMLPQIDPASAALTRADRTALVSAMQANWRADLSKGVGATPDSYVGERIRVAVQFSQARDAMADGALDAESARALNCRMVGLAFDRRAGAYLKGGEAAAQAARASVPKESLERCADAVAKAKARGAPPVARTQVRFAEVSPETRRTAPVRIDLVPSQRVRIDPTPSHRTSIDPKPSRAVGAQYARAATQGRGR